MRAPAVVALAGGVGGAKLADGLARAIGAERLSVVVNTGDDFDLYGLRICPDLDTVMYTLAGIADAGRGWGIAGDTTNVLDAIVGYGRNPWFVLGDRDLATHLLRTDALRAGRPLSAVTAELAAALGVRTAILPMSDDPVATVIETDDGPLAFQDYFVARRQRDVVTGVKLAGIEAARLGIGITTAVAAATLVVICPSNPFVSVGPILAVPGMGEALSATRASVVAVSPIVAGAAIKGPAAAMLASLGHDVSALGVARLYQGKVDGFVIDEVDAGLRPAVEALGMSVLVTRTVMGETADRERLAREIVAWAAPLARARQ